MELIAHLCVRRRLAKIQDGDQSVRWSWCGAAEEWSRWWRISSKVLPSTVWKNHGRRWRHPGTSRSCPKSSAFLPITSTETTISYWCVSIIYPSLQFSLRLGPDWAPNSFKPELNNLVRALVLIISSEFPRIALMNVVNNLTKCR